MSAAKESYPPSYMQQWMLSLQETQGNLPVWNRPLPLEIIGKLDEDALNRVLRMISQRHLPLRSRFDPQEQIWVVARESSDLLNGPCLDFSRHTDQKQAILTYLRDYNDVGFDLTREFPWRGQLLKLGPDHHLLNLTFHHIAMDGGSIPILINDIISFYEQMINNRGPEVTPLTYGFDQFSHAEKITYAKKQADFQHYHQQFFSSHAEPVKLPGYKNNTPPDFRQAYLEKYLDPKMSRTLRAFSADQNITIFMILFSIFNILIFLTTTQKEILLGSFFSDRRHKGLQDTLGLLFNLLPINISLDETMTVTEVIALVRKRSLMAFTKADYPYNKFLEDHAQSETRPLLPVIFQYRNFPRVNKSDAALSIGEYPYHHQFGNFDLTFEAEPVEDKLRLSLSYRTDRYGAAAMCDLLDNFSALVSQILENSTKSISAFNI